MAELGITPGEFWSLTFYDWSLYLYRIRYQRQSRIDDHHLLMRLTRMQMALLANINRKKDAAPFRGEDFITLPGDEKIEEQKPTGEQMFKDMMERFKNKPLHKRG